VAAKEAAAIAAAAAVAHSEESAAAAVAAVAAACATGVCNGAGATRAVATTLVLPETRGIARGKHRRH